MNPIDEVLQSPNEATHQSQNMLFCVDGEKVYFWDEEVRAWELYVGKRGLDYWLSVLTPINLLCPKCNTRISYNTHSHTDLPHVKCSHCHFEVYMEGQHRDKPNAFDPLFFKSYHHWMIIGDMQIWVGKEYHARTLKRLYKLNTGEELNDIHFGDDYFQMSRPDENTYLLVKFDRYKREQGRMFIDGGFLAQCIIESIE